MREFLKTEAGLLELDGGKPHVRVGGDLIPVEFCSDSSIIHARPEDREVVFDPEEGLAAVFPVGYRLPRNVGPMDFAVVREARPAVGIRLAEGTYNG